MLTFLDLQTEVKRRATRNDSGTVYDPAIKNLINTSLFRISREARWRPMRRKSILTTETKYTTGTGAVTATNNSKNVTITGATLITNGIKVGRRITISGSNKYYTIKTITGETTLTLDVAYDGTTTTTGTYIIYGTEDYNLPIQAGHSMFLWHERYGYPYMMNYITDMDFYSSGASIITQGVPIYYRMWGEDMIIRQPNEGSVLRVTSSSSSDTSVEITIFGTVSGYPDYEIISTNGTSPVSGSKVFTQVERIVKSSSTTGRITVDSNSGNVTVAVLPVGDATGGILYKKIQLWPLPEAIFDINVQYYKDPFRLVNNGDVHELGQEFDEAIILLATAKLKMEQNQKEGREFIALYRDEINSLKRVNVDKLDSFPDLRRPEDSNVTNGALHRYVHYQQLGSYYGPRSYR